MATPLKTSISSVQDATALVQSTIELVQQGLRQFDEVNTGSFSGRSVVVVGSTGVGKSTLINLLAERELEAVYDDTYGTSSIRAVDTLPGFPIGHSLTSETSIPRRWMGPDGVAYWDCPGLNDTRGVAQQIANAICVRNIFMISTHSKIVVMVDSPTLRQQRSLEFIKFILQLAVFLGNSDQIRKSLSLVVSQAPSDFTEPNVQRTLIQIMQDLPSMRDLPFQGLIQPLLAHLRDNPMCLFREPDIGISGHLETSATRVKILSNLNQIPFTEHARVNIGLSPEAKQIALTTYNTLAVHIRENVHHFLDRFREGIHAFVAPYSDPNLNLFQSGRESSQKILHELAEKLGVLSSGTYSLDTVGTMISECQKIAQECHVSLSKEYVEQALGKLALIQYFEQFVDTTARIPLDIIKDTRDQLAESRNTLERAFIQITALNESDRADREAKLAVQEARRGEEERHKAAEAEKRYQEIIRASKASEMEYNLLESVLNFLGQLAGPVLKLFG